MSDDSPRAYTPEEMRHKFLSHVRAISNYWASDKITFNNTLHERLNGLVFSLLVLFDGGSGDMPGFDIVCRPHPDDEAFCKSEQTNWVPPGAVINEDTQLHEEWSSRYEGK